MDKIHWLYCKPGIIARDIPRPSREVLRAEVVCRFLSAARHRFAVLGGKYQGLAKPGLWEARMYSIVFLLMLSGSKKSAMAESRQVQGTKPFYVKPWASAS